MNFKLPVFFADCELRAEAGVGLRQARRAEP